MINHLTFLMLLFSTVHTSAQKASTVNQPQELGKVSWLRNYNEAVKLAKTQNKPILILFQEVPGCITCQNYGNDVLSNPLIVDAIENEFVALAIYNNKKGHDGEILKKFNEPSWNNPVVRIIDFNGKDLISRLSGQYDKKALTSFMVLALSAGYYPQPQYLKLLHEEFETPSKISSATYSMYCFWSGEAHLGSLNGITKTEPGFMNGKEVVRVSYNPNIISKATINKHAQTANCKLETESSLFREDKDPQYYLKQSNLKFLALTDLQKTKINSALKNGSDAKRYLSPSQKTVLTKITNGELRPSKILYDQDFTNAWNEMLNI